MKYIRGASQPKTHKILSKHATPHFGHVPPPPAVDMSVIVALSLKKYGQVL